MMITGIINGPLANIQTITADDFIYDSNRINLGLATNISGKNYILVNITDAQPTIYMIDSADYYVSGYMRQIPNTTIYTYICCSAGKVIQHNTEPGQTKKKVSFYDFSHCNRDLPDIGNPPNGHLNIGEIIEKLDTIAFILCESLRFEAIHDYIKFSGSVCCEDLMILVNNWTAFGRRRTHIPKRETHQWLYQQAAHDPRITNYPLYKFLETGVVPLATTS